MENRPRPYKVVRYLTLNGYDMPSETIEKVGKALGARTRLDILRLLGERTLSVFEIAERLGLPQSTAALHINVLENAGLIRTTLKPATRGLQKVCTRDFDQISILLPDDENLNDNNDGLSEVSMPIGAYVDFRVTPTCGISSEQANIGFIDDPSSFFEPHHIYAQHLWFRIGYVEYKFPNRLPSSSHLLELSISFEACSEVPTFDLDWPSDISVWINGKETGVWTSPADYGGKRGLLTPSWVSDTSTQYGILKTWKVTSVGTHIDGVKASGVTLADLNIQPEQPITVRIGVREDAKNPGGINLFGARFGNYAQDILMKMRYKRAGI